MCSSKSLVPESFAALFIEADRDLRPLPSDDYGGADAGFRYTATRDVVLRRMSLLGASKAAAASAFENWLKSERETWEEYREDGWGQVTADVMDVNGQAAGIELYLGERALREGETLRPVRWTGFVSAANAYQGEVEGKNQVLAC